MTDSQGNQMSVGDVLVLATAPDVTTLVTAIEGDVATLIDAERQPGMRAARFRKPEPYKCDQANMLKSQWVRKGVQLKEPEPC